MAHYLLVAHQTAERQELLDEARKLAAHDPHAKFALLVPATPIGDLLTWEEGEAKDAARSKADAAAATLRGHGINVVDVKVGDADPVLAVDDDYRAGSRYDAIVVSTLPAGLSRWIKMDVISRMRRQHPHVRLIHVVSKSAEPRSNVGATPADHRKGRATR